MNRRRHAWFAGVSMLSGLLVIVLAAEAVLRVLPVASGLRTATVTSSRPVYHFTPNRDYLFSRDWDMALINRGRVNNVGFVNRQDYRKDDTTPLLAVIGDSMIEALMVPYAETLQGRLESKLAGRVRVYSFAASGAPLSQYLVWARHAARDYGARALIFNVIRNDFDESHAAYKIWPGFWHYVPDERGQLHLRLFEYEPGFVRAVTARSALARYLFLNLGLSQRWLELRSLSFARPVTPAPRFAGNTGAGTGDARIRDSLAVIDAFFRDLPGYCGLPPARIAFVLDGFRDPATAAESRGTYFDRMRTALSDRARALGYEVIDLDPWFFARHRRSGERFDFKRDRHWNSAGHEVAFDAVLGSRLLAELIHEPRAPVGARP